MLEMGVTMQLIVLVIAMVLAVGILSTIPRIPMKGLRIVALIGAVLVFVGGLVMSSVAYVGANEVGIVTKNALGSSLKDGRIIAVDGEMGVQAEVLAPGWHWGLWPVLYSVSNEDLVVVPADQVGIIETTDGVAMTQGMLFAPEWGAGEVSSMLDAQTFLTTGKGFKGKQTTVLKPGTYRLNTRLYKVKFSPQTVVIPGEVAVLTANFGDPPTKVVEGPAGSLESGADSPEANATPPSNSRRLRLAGEGEMGIRAETLPPGKYPLNTDAFTVTEIWTTQMIAHYTASGSSNPVPSKNDPSRATRDAASDERAITVITRDGFQFPVDVRIEYFIEPHSAPIVVAKLGDDEKDRFHNALNSAVRAIFRNNAEKVAALDYVQQRSHQEKQSLDMLADEMSRFGVSITAVRIGAVGDEETLGTLLKTQRDREIAKQQLETYKEQEKAAEQKKSLTRAEQEAEEERKLATASYAVQIAEQEKSKKLIEAATEAESIEIRAKAQAAAYAKIAESIGASNAALIEILKVVGERNIQITPRVMVNGSGGSGEGAALVGTMLDALVKEEGAGGGEGKK
ncbi:MAG: hypothetical protein IPK69_10665 [Phycisphaerales bacterium]|nr:MAG: hypothetical protein IPK69_10665 [Phycisphaerales bacterium]